MLSEFSARRKHSYASIDSFRIVGDGGSGMDVGDSCLRVSRGEMLSIVIGMVAGSFRMNLLCKEIHGKVLIIP